MLPSNIQSDLKEMQMAKAQQLKKSKAVGKRTKIENKEAKTKLNNNSRTITRDDTSDESEARVVPSSSTETHNIGEYSEEDVEAAPENAVAEVRYDDNEEETKVKDKRKSIKDLKKKGEKKRKEKRVEMSVENRMIGMSSGDKEEVRAKGKSKGKNVVKKMGQKKRDGEEVDVVLENGITGMRSGEDGDGIKGNDRSKDKKKAKENVKEKRTEEKVEDSVKNGITNTSSGEVEEEVKMKGKQEVKKKRNKKMKAEEAMENGITQMSSSKDEGRVNLKFRIKVNKEVNKIVNLTRKEEEFEVAMENGIAGNSSGEDEAEVKVEGKGKDGKEVKKSGKRKRKEEKDEERESALYVFPMNRVSKMIRSENPDIRISQEAIFLINKASEKFLQLFCREVYASAFLDHKNYVAYNHLSSVLSKRSRFNFLSDFVPQKVKAEDALKEASEAEK